MGVLDLRSRRDQIVQSMLDGLMKVPSYAVLRENHGRTLLEELHYALDRTLQLASSDEPATEADLDFFGEIGRRRSADMFPVDDLQAGFRLSYIAGLREAFEDAEASNHTALMDLTTYGAREHPRMLQAAVLAYAQSYRMHASSDPARGLLIERLLQGKASSSVAEAVGITLPTAYVVLLCRSASRAEPTLTERQATDQCLKALPGALCRGRLVNEGLTLLLPADPSFPGVTEALAGDIVHSLGKATRKDVYAVRSGPQRLDTLAEVHEEAQEALRVLAVMPGMQGRPYRVEELVVELAASRQPALRTGLASLMEPLASRAELLRTLEVLFAYDLDRERTARALFIHRRTLTYRIKRIRELSGLAPTTPHGIQLLRLGLTASRLS